MSLRARLAKPDPVLAPLVLNPLMAALAREAGFEALYLGGGSTGYAKVSLEANLSLTEMVQTGVEIRAAVDLPLILDGACGWGDPMHMHRTVNQAEIAGFDAIEIEDQILPKRAHHHVGIEHMVPTELMVAKIREAVVARRRPDFLIVARTNAVRHPGMDDALRRAEAYRAAGADLLLLPRAPEDIRLVGERIGGPLMYLCPPGGLAALDMTTADMAGLGYRILVDPTTPLLAAYETMRAVYTEMAQGFRIRSRPHGELKALQERMHETIGLETLLEIERRTVERGH